MAIRAFSAIITPQRMTADAVYRSADSPYAEYAPHSVFSRMNGKPEQAHKAGHCSTISSNLPASERCVWPTWVAIRST